MILSILMWTVLSLLLLSYVLYPLLAVLIGAGHSTSTNGLLPAISVLVPAHNEAAVIAAKIANFHTIDYPPELIELVIADDGSTDQTCEIVRQHLNSRVHLLGSESREGKAATMNRLVQNSDRPFLLFSDANVMFSTSAVQRLVDAMNNPRIGSVTGEVRLVGSGREFRSGEDLYYWMERRIQGAESRVGSVMGVDGGMYLMRRELFRPLPDDTILDDFLVSIKVMRQGKRVAYESAAKATESGTPTVAQEFSRRTRIAAGAVQLLRRRQVPKLTQPILWGQFVLHKLLRWLSPILLLALLTSNLLLIGAGPIYRVMIVIQLILLAAIVTTFLIPRIRHTLLGGVLFYFGISQVAMAVGLFRGVLNLQSPKWDKVNRTCEIVEKNTGTVQK